MAPLVPLPPNTVAKAGPKFLPRPVLVFRSPPRTSVVEPIPAATTTTSAKEVTANSVSKARTVDHFLATPVRVSPLGDKT